MHRVTATPPFSLRAVEPADAEWILDACQDVDVQRWTLVPRPYTRAHAESFAAGEFAGHTVWAIADSAGDGAGVISIHEIDATGEADVGYWVAPWARRQGAVTTALAAVVEHARTLGVGAVTLKIAETNVASRRAAAAAGFVEVGPTGCTCPDGDVQVPGVLHRLPI